MTCPHPRRALLLLATCLALPGVAAAQETFEPAPSGTLLERAQSWVADNPVEWFGDLRDSGVYPRIVSFAPGTGASPGIDYWHPTLAGGIGLMASVAQSFRGDSLFQLRFGTLPGPARALRLQSGRHSLEGLAPFRGREEGESPLFAYTEFTFRELESGRLYSASPQQIDFASDDSAYDAVVGYAFSSRLAATARVGWYTTMVSSVGDGTGFGSGAEALREAGLTGYRHRLDFARLGLEVAFDTRDDANNPHAGSFAALSLWYYGDQGSRTTLHPGSYSFSRLHVDARHFQPLGSPRHVLALRAGASLADPSERGIPFHMQEALGGSQVLRGYPGFRFRGHDLASASAEYRFEVHPRVELAAFYDAGRVWGGLAEREQPGFLWSWGGGIRFKTADSVLLRLDLARGREGSEVHLKLGYSF